jgi:hypothetical protein
MNAARRILFIGNSYTFCNDLPQQLSLLAASAGAERRIETALTASGGWTLEQHWDDRRCRELLDRGGWDEVVLQEQTRRPYEDTARYHESVRRFQRAILALGGKTILYLTWAPGLEPERQRELDAGVGGIAQELGVTVVPAGPAFALVRARAPQLPLYVVDDQRHPSPQGTYLAACTFVAVLLQRSPIGLPAQALAGDAPTAQPFRLDEAAARVLQEAASEAAARWRTGAPSPQRGR